MQTLATVTFCKVPGCNLAALAAALGMPHTYKLAINVIENIPVLTRLCSARPCYVATVTVAVPRTAHVYTVTTNDNRLQRVRHTSTSPNSTQSPTTPLCL